ncbi:TetR/AcrR family transcriptional regulator [Shewanella canadensis]|uniref:TetR/AcrR family transcriptional regulator n=1 Tax=Shewanella canadensis TaxID=271096 RepID=A0A3S0KUH7_9GAMM|nr:TetR/AcrR family transcriptional regulator [Shewanella canadensis]RTR38764.1 TetR/AcrR family transcriptional regulator [Shewanella canadensis]
MTKSSEINTRKKRKSLPQNRGNLRREKLILAGKSLLEERCIEDISLANVAKLAEIPLASSYHFFPNINSLWVEIASVFGTEISQVIFKSFTLDEDDNWQAIIRICIRRAAELYRNNRSYQQLIIGGKTPAYIKLADRRNDEVIGRLLIDAIEDHFVIPDFPDQAQVFFHAVEIADLMFMLSVNKHDEITDKMEEEAKRASIAYLKCYLGEFLHQ